MKQTIITLACAIAVSAGVGATAQNPDQAKQNEAIFKEGKAKFSKYDDFLGKKQLGMLKDGENIQMSDALLDGYGLFMQVLPNDTTIDAKGKVKTKHSKNIASILAGHYNDFTSAGSEFWNAKDYKKAYDSWTIFVDLSRDADRYGIKAQPDTIVADFMFNRALAAWQLDDPKLAVQSFLDAMENGYDKEQLFEYGISVAQGAKDYDALLKIATEGNRLYGKTNTDYINQIINYYLQTEKYDEAIQYLDNAIAENPDNAQYYVLEGLIYDNKEDLEKAGSLYQKSLSLDPENALANFYYGRSLALKGGQLADSFVDGKGDFEAFFNKQVKPLYQEAAKYIEKSYELDENNRSECLRVLDTLYYNLNDAAGLESVNKRKIGD